MISRSNIVGWAGSRLRYALVAAIVIAAGMAPAAGWPDVRISVKDRGMYYVSADDLATVLGITNTLIKAEILSGSISLTTTGSQVAYAPAGGGDGFYFFGEAIESMFTKENVYRLGWSHGITMAQMADSGPAAIPGTTFTETIHYEDARASAVGAEYANGPEDDYWWWAQLSAADPPGDKFTCTNNVYGPDRTAAQAQLTAWVRSVSESGTTNEHEVIVKLNGAEIGQTNWTGRQDVGIVLPFVPSLLNDGSNMFEVRAALGGGAAFSIIYVDSFDLAYERTYAATNGCLVLKGGSNTVVTADGFTSSGITVADLTDVKKPILLSGVNIEPTGTFHRVSFAPTNGAVEYVAFDSALAPVQIAAIEDSGLKSTTNSADYVIITPEEFLSAAQSLATYRTDAGFTVRVAVLDDIYDEFSYGLPDPAAIRAMLGYAYTNWIVSPKYVVLAGAGTWDYKDYKGYGDCIVPVKMVDLPYGLYASDGWFGDMDGDRLPEMAIGRLPAVTDAELQTMVDRIIGFEQAASERWQETVVMAADNPDGGGDFHKTSDRLASIIPGEFAVNKVHMLPATISESHDTIVSNLNSGALLFNYFGHGGPAELADWELLEADDIAGLTNSNRLCLVTAWSCVMGRFAAPAASDCLGEEFMLAPTGGAVAVWAPAGQAFNRSSEALAQALYHRIFLEKDRLLGDAILGAMTSYSQQNMGQYLLSLYNLMGDPALKFRGTRLPSDGVYSDIMPAFVDWKWDYFTESEMDDESKTGDLSDADGDGRLNLAEYVFGGNPTNSDSGADMVIPVQDDIQEDYDMAVAFTRNKWVSGVQVKLLMSTNLISWESADAYIRDTKVIDDGNQRTETVILYVAPPADSSSRFFRLKIE